MGVGLDHSLQDRADFEIGSAQLQFGEYLNGSEEILWTRH